MFTLWLDFLRCCCLKALEDRTSCLRIVGIEIQSHRRIALRRVSLQLADHIVDNKADSENLQDREV
jgi:hypothetical protein